MRYISKSYHNHWSLLLILMLSGVVWSCSPHKDFVYLQDLQDNVTMAVQEVQDIKLQPGDKLNIVVHSRDKELVEMFNLTQNGIGRGGSSSNSAYTVDDLGQIEMPILGLISVKGLTRLELANLIKYKLLASKLVRDPIVSVDYHEMYYYTLGQNSGKHPIERDRLTILEVLSEMGGLDLQTRHDNVLVLRTVDGKQTPYRVNTLNVNDLYSSPAYYIQQNDIIITEPTAMALDATTPLGNSWKSPFFWVSALNTVLTISLLFYK